MIKNDAHGILAPETAPVWLFPLAVPIAESRQAEVLQIMKRALADWHTHGNPIKAASCFLNEYLLAVVLLSDELPSGCSKDSLREKVVEVLPSFGTRLLDVLELLLCTRDKLHVIDRSQLATFKVDGEYPDELKFLDLSVQSWGGVSRGQNWRFLKGCFN